MEKKYHSKQCFNPFLPRSAVAGYEPEMPERALLDSRPEVP